MNSQQYWQNREAEQLKHNITDEKDFEKKLEEIYEDMLKACENEINAFYGRYADKEGITMAEAKKRVSETDIKAYERKAKKYVKAAAKDRKANGGQTDFDGDYFSEEANEEMRLYNLTMKVNRLEMLKANIGLELIKGHDELEQFMAEILQGRTEDELKRQAGILGETITNNAKLANSIVNASFHNATFSDRIWLYQDLLKADIEKELKSGLIQGKSARTLARNLKNTFGVRTSDAERLMRTELARVQTDAQKKSFEKNGFELYRFICNVNPTKGNHTCADCERLANTKTKYGVGVYRVEDMMPGTNAPPMHPNCRCSTAAYEDSKDYEEWLEFLANGGTTEEWNRKKTKTDKPNILGIQKPKRPRKSDFEDEDEYYMAREEYRLAKEKYEEDFERIVGEMLKAKQAFKSKEEAIEWAKKNGLTIDGDVFESVDLRSFNEVKSTLEEMFDRFPEIKSYQYEDFDGTKHKTTFRIGLTDDGLLSANGGFNFNKRMFADYEVGLRDGLEQIAEGWFVQGDGSFSGLVRHEYGHNVQSYIETCIADKYHHNVDDWRKYYKNLNEYKVSESAYFEERRKYESELVALARLDGASEYAQTNTLELFAEGFAEYTSGSETEFGKGFGEFLERWYK